MYKVYVGCLPASCTAEQLSQFFSFFGQIADTKVSKKSGSKLCSGNGTFTCLSKLTFDSIVAIREFNFFGRTVFCEGKLTGDELLLKNQILSRRRIFVSNLPTNLSDRQIEESMKVFGLVQNGYRIKTLSNKQRPFGFVTFYEEISAEIAIRAETIVINGQPVYISPFKKNNSSRKKTDPGEAVPNEQTSLTSQPQIHLSTDLKSISAKVQAVPQGTKLALGSRDQSVTKASVNIKPTSVRYHVEWHGLNHGETRIRFNVQLMTKRPLPCSEDSKRIKLPQRNLKP